MSKSTGKYHCRAEFRNQKHDAIYVHFHVDSKEEALEVAREREADFEKPTKLKALELRMNSTLWALFWAVSGDTPEGDWTWNVHTLFAIYDDRYN